MLDGLDLPTHPTMRDPRTGDPVRALGWTRRGPVWPVMGGDGNGTGDGGGTGGDGGQGGDNGTGGTGDGGQPSGQPGNQQQNSGQQGSEGDVASLPEWAQRMIRTARDGEAKARTNAKQKAAQDAENAVVQRIGKALGLIKDGDGAPDPEKLTQQLTAEQTRAREAQVQLAVYQAAGKNGGDPGALLDSRSFLAKVADLDPTSNDFGDKVAEAIKAAVKDNPKLAAGQAPARSGGDHSGGPGGGNRNRPTSLGAAIKGHYGN